MPTPTMLKRRMIPKGTVIVREGDTDTCAYQLLAGRVEVYKEAGAKRVVLARLGVGQFFGEMNLVAESARTASVQAIESCQVRVISAEVFSRLLTQRPKSALPILKVLLERLRVMNVKYTELLDIQERGHLKLPASQTHAAPTISRTAAASAVPGGLRLVGLTPAAQQALGKDGVQIRTFPFRIGRKIGGALADALSLNDLYIQDSEPYQVSRNHCAIDLAPDGAHLVLDRGSSLGTIVNGDRIGSAVKTFEAPLTAAQNTLALGNSTSPFRFQLTRLA